MAEYQLASFDRIKDFVFGGNSIFTVLNTESGKRFTYKVTTPKGDKRGNVWFVSVLNGPNNYENYAYMGIVNGDRSRFNLTKKSRVGADALSYKGFDWLFKQITKDRPLPDKVEFYHEGRCGRCGRRLTTPESIEQGFGPECIGKIGF